MNGGLQATAIAALGAAVAAFAVACACLPAALAGGPSASGAPAAAASRDAAERQISIEHLHLGLTPGGRVGVYVAYTPRRPRGLRTVSVAIGSSPRMVYGFYKGDRILASPLRDVFPNDNELRSGRSYRVVVSFCRTDAPARGATAHAAKVGCDRRSFISRTAYLHRRFDPPARSSSAYRCYVGDALNYGYRPGWVDASGSVDCSGYRGAGSVKFTVRLQRKAKQGTAWHTVNSVSRRYHVLSKRHLLSASRRCRDASFRAIFTAALYDAGGHRVSTNRQVLGPVDVVAACVVTIR